MCNNGHYSRYCCPNNPGEDVNHDGWCKHHSWVKVKEFNSRTGQWEHLVSCSLCESQNRRESSAKARAKSNRKAKEKAREERARQASTSSGNASEKTPWKLPPIVVSLLWDCALHALPTLCTITRSRRLLHTRPQRFVLVCTFALEMPLQRVRLCCGATF